MKEKYDAILSKYTYNTPIITDKRELVIISYGEGDLKNTYLYLNNLKYSHYSREVFTEDTFVSTCSGDVSRVSRLLAEVGCTHIPSSVVCICDTITKKNECRKGYASAILGFLADVSKKQNISAIIGYVSEVDYNESDHLRIFYEKNGFKVYNYTGTEHRVKQVIIRYI